MHDPVAAFDVDEHGYPGEEGLDGIRCADMVGRGGRWLIEDLPRLAAQVPCAVVEVTDTEDPARGPAKQVVFATRGWSGAESLIAAVLGNLLLRAMYYVKWERGGRYTFVVPLTDPSLQVATDGKE